MPLFIALPLLLAAFAMIFIPLSPVPDGYPGTNHNWVWVGIMLTALVVVCS